MTKPLVTRLILSLIAHKIRSVAGDGIASQLIDLSQGIFPEFGLGSLDEIEGAIDTSGQLTDAFYEADKCFRRSAPEKLAAIISSGGISFQGIDYLEKEAKAISEGKEIEFLADALRKDLSTTFRTVLEPKEIDQCVDLYLHCLEEAVYKYFPSQRAIINLLYKSIKNDEDTSKRLDQTNSSLNQILEILDLLKEDSGISQGSGKRLQMLPHRWYEKLVGRDQEVNEIYQEILDGKSNMLVLFGTSGVGIPSIMREVVEKLITTPDREINKETDEVFIIWHKIPANTRDKKQAFDDLRYYISQTLGIDSPSIIDQIQALQTGFNVIVIDGLRSEISPIIIEYIINFLYPNVRVVIICQEQLHWEKYRCKPVKKMIGGLKQEYIPQLFRLHGYYDNFTEEQLHQLSSRTEGNVQRLINCANDLVEGFSFEEMLERNDESVEEIVLQLSAPSHYLLKVISLYDDFAHSRALAFLVNQKYPGQVNHATEELRRRLIISKDQNGSRYQVGEIYRQYVIQEMQKNEEYDEIRDQWTDFYCKLRDKDRRQDFNDEIGWTIFTDYQPEKEQTINYSDEASNLLSVINYCLGESRVASHWTKAAKLLDDFRATIFASGRWDDRLKYCIKVVEYAKAENNLALLGKFYRLQAWISCFRDEYEDGEPLANEAIRIARQGLKVDRLTDQDRYTHHQTLYKAYNTLGQIALRKARRARQAAQQVKNASQAKDEEQVAQDSKQLIENHIANAVILFRDAEIKFAQALLLLEEFPPESLIMEYHMAEVMYYDRAPVSVVHPELAAFYTFEQLNRVLPMFLSVLSKAQQPYPEFHVNRPHQRLIANTKLHIGKTMRRLAALLPKIGAGDNSEYYSGAYQHLSEALSIANQNNDRVLKAKIRFAQCQWYESKSKHVSNDDEREYCLTMAKELAQEAIQDFQKTRMRLEGDDAQIFFLRLQ